MTWFELFDIHKISYMILRGSVAHGYQYFLDENSLNLESVMCFELSEIHKISYMILFQYFLDENSLNRSL